MPAIAIAAIRLDGGTQPRAAIHQDWIKEYAEDMLGGAKFPPVVVFFDGTDYWLADGFHRTAAAEASGAADIDADIRQGTQRDAILFSVSANSSHGQRRTNEDKRRAVLRLLNDPEWSGWSDREIARRCGVNHEMVGKLKPAPLPIVTGGSVSEPKPTGRTYVTKHGTVSTMNTAGINADRQRPEPQQPRKSFIEVAIATATGIITAEDDDPPPEGYSRIPGYERVDGQPTPSAGAPSPKPTPRFDHEAAAIRNSAMDAIRALSEQPEPEAVLEAWMKHGGYGEPVEMIEKAIGWLTSFLPLYREAEPRRWADRQEKLRNVA